MTPVERLALCLLPVLVACAHVKPAVTTTGAYFDRQGRIVSEAELRNRLNTSAFTLMGEAHDNPCDHDQERRLIELSGQAGPFAVGLEMTTFQQQATLDAFSAGTVDLNDLPTALDWKKTWGFSFDSYAPLFTAARTSNAPIIGLNAPEAVVHAVRSQGLAGVPEDQKASVTPSIIPARAEQEQMLREAMSQHAPPAASADAEARWARFSRVQSFWDSQMAWRAARARQELNRRMVIFAGGGHVEHGWGIPWRLSTFAPGASTLTIMPWRGGDFDPDEADLFFFCPEAKPSSSAMVPPWTKPDSTSSPRTP